VFVVGYDRDIVADLVHQSKGYTDAIRSQDYLEKIIQTTFRIPRSSSDHSEALLAQCLDGSGTRDLFGDAERSLVIERNARNPRRIKRFLNGFVLTYGLDQQWRQFSPETLIRVHLLYMYFKPFSDLLERPGERDPVEEFIEYYAARDVLRRRGDVQLVEPAFKSHELAMPPNASHDTLLAELENNLPVPFKALAAQDGFGTLVASLAAAPDWPALRGQLAEGRTPVVVPPDTEKGALDGLSAIWVDDEPDHIRDHAQALQSAGALVFTAEDTEHVRTVLEHGPVDVLISDIGRDGRPEGGFEDLRTLRAAGLAPRTVIFFTTRVTPARQAAAAELGSDIVGSWPELERRLQSVPSGAQPAA
jgi:CheY-like chemotaxis protein